MNISSYIYGTSFYHRFDVRPKLFFTFLFSVLSFALSSYISVALVFLIPIAIMILSVGGKETWRCYSRLIPLFLIMILFIPLQNRDGNPLLVIHGFTIITAEGLWSVMKIISRLGGISGVLMLLLLSERNEDIIKGLRAFHLPYNAALAASMILRYIPYLGYLFSEIRASMSLRLEEGKRGYPVLPSITALVIAAIKMIPDTASALEERGFGRVKPAKDAIPHPSGYLIQWLFGAIIPLSLFLVR